MGKSSAMTGETLDSIEDMKQPAPDQTARTLELDREIEQAIAQVMVPK